MVEDMDISRILQLRLFNREIMNSIWEWINDPRIIVLVGSRQVGKTCILYLLIKRLIENGIKPDSVFYFDLEDFEFLNLFNAGVRDVLRYLEIQGMNHNERNYIFVDEIQYMEDPSNFLKLVADHHKSLKFICSGSSTLEVRRKFTDSLAGRKVVFEIPTLTFRERLLFKGEGTLMKLLKDYPFDDIGEPPLDIHRRQLQSHYEQHVIYGGYPAVVLENDRERKLRLLRDIYESYVRKDINQLFTVENITSFNNLVKMLALQIGNLVNLHELTTNLSISRPTVEKYLLTLENTFILKRIPPFFANKRKEIVKMPKVYYHDTGMRNQVIRNFQQLSLRTDAGALVENSVFKSLNVRLSLLEDLKFWRMKNGSEVDFIVEGEQLMPVEAKYTEMNSPRVHSGIRSFIGNYNPPRAIVVTKDYFEKVEVNDCYVIFMPAYLLS